MVIIGLVWLADADADADDSFVVTEVVVLPLISKVLDLGALTAVTSTRGHRSATGPGDLLAIWTLKRFWMGCQELGFRIVTQQQALHNRLSFVLF